MKIKKQEDRSYLWMLKELERAGKRGIPTIVNGILYADQEKKEVPFLFENAAYMEDFVEDSNGKIIQIHFDQIRHFG